MKKDPVPRELVERIIEAAVWAPNHHRTEPWKFVVMTGDGRQKLGSAYAEIASEKLTGVTEEEKAQRLEKEKEKALRAPVVIAAVCAPSDDPKVIRAEEKAAVHAAVQNMLLAAHANGLGAVWRTGEPAYHPAMKRWLGLESSEEVVGLIYMGYPDMEPPEGRRIPGTAKTVWLEE